MKISPILTLLAVCAPIIAHAQNATTPDVAALPMAPASAATSDAFVWRFAPPVGSKWTMRSFMRTTSTNQDLLMTYTNKLTADYDILSRDALSATTIRVTLRDVTQDRTSTYQGKTTSMAAPKIPASRSINGATLTIKQAPDGKVWGVVGMRAFVRRILKMDSELDTKRSDEILEATVVGSQEEIVKQFNIITGTLPTSPVRVGESWSGDMNVPAPFGFKVGITRTVKNLGDGVAAITDRASYGAMQEQSKLSAFPSGGRAGTDYSQLNGVIYGVSQVQRSSGLPLESTMYQRIYGSISTQSAAGTREQPIDTTISTRVVLEPRN